MESLVKSHTNESEKIFIPNKNIRLQPIENQVNKLNSTRELIFPKLIKREKIKIPENDSFNILNKIGISLQMKHKPNHRYSNNIHKSSQIHPNINIVDPKHTINTFARAYEANINRIRVTRLKLHMRKFNQIISKLDQVQSLSEFESLNRMVDHTLRNIHINLKFKIVKFSLHVIKFHKLNTFKRLRSYKSHWDNRILRFIEIIQNRNANKFMAHCFNALIRRFEEKKRLFVCRIQSLFKG